MENTIQGLIDTVNKYTICKNNDGTNDIVFKNRSDVKIHCYSHITDRDVKCIADALNDAYKRGFCDCSIKLMNNTK